MYISLSFFSYFRSSGVTLHDTCNRDHISSAVSSSHYCQPVKKIVRLELPSNVSFTQVCDGVSEKITNIAIHCCLRQELKVLQCLSVHLSVAKVSFFNAIFIFKQSSSRVHKKSLQVHYIKEH